MTTNSRVILEVSDLTVDYGPVRALDGMSLHVNQGEIVALLGPNGAGKSTLMYALAGILPITRGRITLNGKAINGLIAEEVVKQGMTLVPEGRLLFSTMSTIDNLMLGSYRRRSKEEQEMARETLDYVFKVFPILKARRRQPAGTLSGGEQQMAAVGRGLMSSPQVLLLDEASLGLAPLLVKELMNTLAEMRKERGLSIILAEQNARAALKIADRGYVLGTGKIVLEGTSEHLQTSDAIKLSYLGTS